MNKFIEVTDIQTNRVVLININHIETITDEAYGTTICLALQGADVNEPNIIHTTKPLADFKKIFANYMLTVD